MLTSPSKKKMESGEETENVKVDVNLFSFR